MEDVDATSASAFASLTLSSPSDSLPNDTNNNPFQPSSQPIDEPPLTSVEAPMSSSRPNAASAPYVHDEGELNPFTSDSVDSLSVSENEYTPYDSRRERDSTNGTHISSTSPTHMVVGAEYITRQHAHSLHSGLKKVLGWPQLIALGVGCTIGSGIFVVTGAVANQQTGPALFLSYIISGVACLLSAFSYAEFASMSPTAGSAYGYARATMGELVGWVIGWDLILEYGVSAATVAQGWSQYFNVLLELMGGYVPSAVSQAPWDYNGSLSSTGAAFDLPAIFITLVLTLILVKGMSESSRVNDMIVILKVTIVLFVIFAGAGYVKSANFSPFMPYGFAGISFFGYTVVGSSGEGGNAVGVLAGSSIAFFSYIGFDAVTCNAEECKNPQRDLPVGIIGSLLISTGLYVAVSVVLCGMVPYTMIDKNAPISAAFQYVGLGWAESIIAIGALAGITSVMIVTLMGQPRILMAMARDGLLPQKVFAEIHPTFGTPWKSTILTGLCVSLIAGFIPQGVLLEIVSIGTLSAFTMVNIGIIIMRRSHPELPRKFHCPLVPWLPAAGALLCFFMMLSLPSENWIRLVVWWTIGLCIYYYYGRQRSRRPQNLEELKRQIALEDKRKKEAMAMANGESLNERDSSLELEMTEMKKTLRDASLLMEERSQRSVSRSQRSEVNDGVANANEVKVNLNIFNDSEAETSVSRKGDDSETKGLNQSYLSDSDFVEGLPKRS